jgi:hypothetical protein
MEQRFHRKHGKHGTVIPVPKKQQLIESPSFRNPNRDFDFFGCNHYGMDPLPLKKKI